VTDGQTPHADISCISNFHPSIYLFIKHIIKNFCMVPLQKCDIEQIEKIQRRATKLVISLKKLLYKERLLRLNLYKLKYRRLPDYVVI